MSRTNGFCRLETTRPRVLLLPAAKVRAWKSGRYLRASAIFKTRARVLSLTRPLWLRTRETVDIDTPARAATPSSFIGRRPGVRRDHPRPQGRSQPTAAGRRRMTKV